MKKKLLILVLLLIIAFFFFSKKDQGPFMTLENQPLPSLPVEKVTTPLKIVKKDIPKPSVSRIPANYREMKDFLPFKIPSQLRNRWEQKIVDEDDKYITSQLYLDGRRLEEYFFRWEKLDSQLSLVAGELPEVTKLAASFPSKAVQSQKINELLSDQGKLLSSKEIWIIDSTGSLLPFIKIEVQRSEPQKRSNGHEYWIFDILKNKVSKTIQADRY
jgi:hypothetical protein